MCISRVCVCVCVYILANQDRTSALTKIYFLNFLYLHLAVLSAVGGIKEATSALTDNMIMWISVVILIILFQVQRFGTDKVGYSFAPILTIWFLFIGIVGIYNFFKYDPRVIKAINPMYIVEYFRWNRKNA